MLDEENPEYLAVAFDVKAPTKRHELYSEYKGTRHAMPDELKAQMPLIKDVLKAMNIKIYEKEGYEADDILGTLAKFGEENNLEVKLLTGDRDSFQLASNKTTIMIPHTKQGKTETDYYDRNKVFEVYGVEPKQMIEVKGLMGDSSDNIPGVAGIGEKTALSLIQKYGSIDGVYEAIDKKDPEIKGKTLEKLESGKDQAYLSRTLGTIDINSPIEKILSDLEKKDWNRQEVLKIFKELRFNRYIDRFDLNKETDVNENVNKIKDINDLFKVEELEDKSVLENIEKLYYYFETKDIEKELPISKEIVSVKVAIDNKIYSIDFKKFKEDLKEIFENENILKIGYEQKQDYILLKQEKIEPKNMMYDVKIASYLLNSNLNQYKIKDLAFNYLNLDLDDFETENKEEQASLFDEPKEEKKDLRNELYCYCISKLPEVLDKKLEEIGSIKLFKEIEMPLVEVLAEMQYIGMYADEKEIYKFGESLKTKLEELRIDIYSLAGGEEFNINSTQQLGKVLFENLGLPVVKKTKTGYSTDNDVLEKLKGSHPIIEKILDYRQIMKLNSTYVDGLIPHINSNTGRIHTHFHQTVTATRSFK